MAQELLHEMSPNILFKGYMFLRTLLEFFLLIGDLIERAYNQNYNLEYAFSKTPQLKKAWVSFLLVGREDVIVLLITSIGICPHPYCHFIPKVWISCVVHLHCFILWQKQLSEVFGLFSSLSKKCLLPMMMSSMYCRCSRASPCSSAIWIGPWQMVGLCFQPEAVNYVYRMLVQVKGSWVWCARPLNPIHTVQ